MKILVAIVHYWNPNGGGDHESLRPDPIHINTSITITKSSCAPLINRFFIWGSSNLQTNNAYRNDITISVITDGINHVLDSIILPFQLLIAISRPTLTILNS